MAKGVRLKFHRQAIEEIEKSPEALALVQQKADAIADACNGQSSWGGYFSAAEVNSDRARARVWSADGRNDEARDQRLIKNLDAS